MTRIRRAFNFFVERHSFFIGLLLVLSGLLYVYKDAVFDDKILFPSNLLASFYSPWSTVTFPGWEHGIPHKPIGGNDQVRLFYPGRTFSNSELLQGKLPTWNPYIFSGSPHLANFQSAIFYPLNFLYLLLPQIDAWSILVVAPFVIGFIGMYLYLKSINVDTVSAHIGSISFAFSGFMSTWTQENAAMGQSACWLPWILFGIEGIARTRKSIYTFFTSAMLMCSFFGGFFQVTFYIYVLAIAYGIYRIFQKMHYRIRTFFLFFCSLLLSLGLVAVQLLPSIEAFSQSPRSSSSIGYLFDMYLLSPTHFIRALIPDLFGNPATYTFMGVGFYHETVIYAGVIPLIFALYAIFFMQRNLLVRFFSFALGISLFLTIKNPVTTWIFSQPIPVISTFLPSRLLFISSALLSILAGISSSYLFTTPKKFSTLRPWILILAIFSFGLILLGVYFGKYLTINTGNLPQQEKIMVMIRNSVLPVGMLFAGFLLIFLNNRIKWSALALLLVTAIGQFYFLNKYAVVGERQFLYPEHHVFSHVKNNSSDKSRFLVFGRTIAANVYLDQQIFSPEGLDAVFPNRYGQLVYAAKNDGKLIKDIPRIEVALLSNMPYPEKITDKPDRLRLMSLLGIKQIFYYREHDIPESQIPILFPTSLFEPLWHKDNWYAFNYTSAYPHAFLVNDYIQKNEPEENVKTLFDPAVDLSKTVVLEEAPLLRKENPPDGQTTEEGEATILEYRPDLVIIQTKTATPQFLFLSDNYYPGWKATIDGKPTLLYRANYTFRAVEVPPGTHLVEFKYESKTLTWGLYLSSASLIILFIAICVHLKKSRLGLSRD